MARKQIVLFPFMAQGHIIPFLALANLIDQRIRGSNYTITLVNTPLNIRNIRSSLPPDSAVRLRELPFSAADHGLPQDSENTDSIPNNLILRLCEATESLQPHFERFLSDLIQQNQQDGRRICVIADIMLGWTVVAARNLGAYHATFSTSGAFGIVAYFSMWLHLPHLHTDAEEFPVPGFSENFRLHRSQLSRNLKDSTGSDPCAVFSRKQISLLRRSDGMLCNTVEEVEATGMGLLRKLMGIPVWATGPIFLREARSSRSRTGKDGIPMGNCVEWLASHPPASVLYVSFGSQNTISTSQMMRLAAGLEASGAPFIWAIRPPMGFDFKGDFMDEWLPEGFEKRARESGKGLLVKDWAPQVEILSHGSVGAFLSHCGWNSILESLSSGVPIVGWPMAAEQFYNSKMLEEDLGVCVELARGVEVDVATEEVERVIRLVIGGSEGEAMRRRVTRIAEMMRAATWEEGQKGASLVALDDFICTVLGE